MKITVKAEAQVPYTSAVVLAEIAIEICCDREETDKQILRAFHKVESIVLCEVDKEMQKAGIKLGPDGLRLTNTPIP